MRDDATNMKSKLLLEFMPATRLKIKCNSAVEQNFQCQIKKHYFVSTLTSSHLHRQLSVPKENSFHFHLCINWESLNTRERWSGETGCSTNTLNVHVEKGCTSDVEFQLKELFEIFFAPFPCRHIPFGISYRLKSFEHSMCGFSNTKNVLPRCLKIHALSICRAVNVMW